MGEWKLRATTILKVSVVAVTFSVFVYGNWSGSTSVRHASATSLTTVPMKVTTTTPNVTVVATTALAPVSTTTTSTSVLPELTTTISDAVIVSMETPVISELEALICDPKWKWDCGEAKAVARCESQMRPSAVSPPNTNGTRDRGLFQVNSVWRDAFGETLWAQILEPEVNVAMAHHIWTVGNESWMYWTCQP